MSLLGVGYSSTVTIVAVWVGCRMGGSYWVVLVLPTSAPVPNADEKSLSESDVAYGGWYKCMHASHWTKNGSLYVIASTMRSPEMTLVNKKHMRQRIHHSDFS